MFARTPMRRTLHPCNPEVKKVAYMSLVRPKLEYASATWNPHTQNDTTRLEKVQRNAARFILSDYERKSSVTDMLYKLNLDTLERRRQHHNDEDLPQSILWSCWHQHSCLDYPVPERQLKICATSFSHQLSSLYSFYPRAIRFWNLLPFNMRNMKDVDAFTQSLTTAVVERLSSQSHAQRRRL